MSIIIVPRQKQNNPDQFWWYVQVHTIVATYDKKTGKKKQVLKVEHCGPIGNDDSWAKAKVLRRDYLTLRCHQLQGAIHSLDDYINKLRREALVKANSHGDIDSDTLLFPVQIVNSPAVDRLYTPKKRRNE